MKRTLVAFMALLAAASAQRFSVEATGGFYTGLSGQLGVLVEDLPGLPLGFRVGVGFASSDALDDTYDTGGGITWGQVKSLLALSEWGQNLTLSADVLLKLAEMGGISVAPYVGARYNMFSGGYTDPQNNLAVKSATFNSNSFGLGAGLRVAYPLLPNLSAVGDLGVDYYFQACIGEEVVDDSGNRASTTTCPSDPSYKSLNDFVTQPDGFVLKLRLGVAYRF